MTESLVGTVTHYDAIRGVAEVKLEDGRVADMHAIAFLSGRPARLPIVGEKIQVQLPPVSEIREELRTVERLTVAAARPYTEESTVQEILTALLKQKMESGDPVILNSLMDTGLAYMKDRLTEQVQANLEGVPLSYTCCIQPEMLQRLITIFTEAQKRLSRHTATARTLENLPDRFSMSVFHQAGLSLENSSTALVVARRILEEAENE